MKRLFGYIRVSTAKQGEGVSLQEQRDAILRYADRHGLTIIEWFEERQTAAKRGRPVFTAMLRALRKGKADGVVIHKIDRSARNLRDWADLGELIDANIDVRFANEPLDLKSRGGRLSADILAVVAADFIRNNREETRKGFYGRLKQGIYPLNAPLGYLDQGGGKVKAIDPVRGPLVRYAFERYATGDVSLLALLGELHAKGLRNRRGSPLTLTGLVTILRNPFYSGLIRLKKTKEVFEGAHARLITSGLYKRVQDVFDGKKPRRVQIHDYLFRRLFACATCSRSLIPSRHKGHVYYRCQTVTCPTTCVREEALESAVAHIFASIAVPEALQVAVAQQIRTIFSNSAELVEASRRRHQGVIAAATTRLERLTDAYVEGLLEKDVYHERRAALLAERQAAQDALATAKETIRDREVAVEKCLEVAKCPARLYAAATIAEKRQLVEILCSNRKVSGKDIDISTAEPFLFLASAQSSIRCAPTFDSPRTAQAIAEDLFRWFETAKEEDIPFFGATSCEDEDRDISALGRAA